MGCVDVDYEERERRKRRRKQEESEREENDQTERLRKDTNLLTKLPLESYHPETEVPTTQEEVQQTIYYYWYDA